MTTEKIIMVDRVPEKLSDEEMKTIKDEYAKYCVDTFKYVQGLDIANKDAKDIVYNHILSPFQYFIEDKVRIRRLNDNGPEVGQQQKQHFHVPATPMPTLNNPAQVPDKPKWRTRY